MTSAVARCISIRERLGVFTCATKKASRYLCRSSARIPAKDHPPRQYAERSLRKNLGEAVCRKKVDFNKSELTDEYNHAYAPPQSP